MCGVSRPSSQSARRRGLRSVLGGRPRQALARRTPERAASDFVARGGGCLRRPDEGHHPRAQVRSPAVDCAAARRADARRRRGNARRRRLRGPSAPASMARIPARLQSGRRAGSAFGTAGRRLAQKSREHQITDRLAERSAAAECSRCFCDRPASTSCDRHPDRRCLNNRSDT